MACDAAWTKGGRTFNSKTGAFQYMGCLCKRTVKYLAMVKDCGACEYTRRRVRRLLVAQGIVDESVILQRIEEELVIRRAKHACRENHNGLTSKSMEWRGAVACALELGECGLYLETLVADDDATTRGHLKARDITTAVNKKTGVMGDLPIGTPTPRWCSDPTHFVRGVGKTAFLQFPNAGKKNKGVAQWIKKLFGYAVKQNRDKGIEVLHRAVHVGVRHAFNEHGDCGVWCPTRRRRTRATRRLTAGWAARRTRLR